jgi:hypothetical protein
MMLLKSARPMAMAGTSVINSRQLRMRTWADPMLEKH